MAIVKLVDELYLNSDALDNMFHYLTSQTNLLNNTASLLDYVGGYNFNLYNINSVADQFKYVKRHFHKTDGSELIHFIISFPSDELKSVKGARTFADYVCQHYAYKYQIFYAIHHRPNNLHIHFILNTVSFVDGTCFWQRKGLTGVLCCIVNNYFHDTIAHFA